MKIAAIVAAVLAVICAAGFSARAAGSHAAPVSRSMVVVATTADVVNGDTSSIAALNRKPGRDGISLREALLAADRTGGSATVYIMFSAALNGKTIEVRSELPPIHRDHIVLEGVAPNGAPARVTLDGREERQRPTPPGGESLLVVHASEVTVRWLRFTGVNPNDSGGGAAGVLVGPGWDGAQRSSLSPATVADIRIEDDVFDNSGFTSPAGGPIASGLLVGPGPIATNTHSITHISAVTIARNTFLNYVTDGDTVGLGAAARGATISSVTIADNRFYQDAYPIEMSASEGQGSERITGNQVIGNTITSSITGTVGIALGNHNAGTNAVIDGTLIADNTIAIAAGNASLINLTADVDQPGPVAPGGNVVSNTQIVNDVFLGGNNDAIYIEGGDLTTSSPSKVMGVTIENDTLVDAAAGNLLTEIPNAHGVTGNTINGVTIRNTIMWEPNGTPIGTGVTDNGLIALQPPDVVMNSLISGPGWAGANGNINANPDFVNEPAGDYQLAAGSPAINAGTTIGAPAYDILGAARRSPPDIGAYEYGALPRPLLAVTLEQLGGSGTVTSSPAGISCETTCDAQFEPGTTVTLTAKPDPRSRFLGWTGACSGKARCTISINSATSVTARFGP
ncbi:MAG: choice-of-anchor Q domain-containing protein [Solirubrobacteraceae bacterium]